MRIVLAAVFCLMCPLTLSSLHGAEVDPAYAAMTPIQKKQFDRLKAAGHELFATKFRSNYDVKFYLDLNNLSVEDAKVLEVFTNAFRVFITDSKLTKEHAQAIGNIKGFKRFRLTNCELSDDFVEGLASCKTIDWFDLEECKLNGHQLENLGPLDSIRRIKIESCQLAGDKGIRLPGTMKRDNIEIYILSEKLPASSISHLAGLDYVSQLVIGDLYMTDDDVKDIKLGKNFKKAWFLDNVSDEAIDRMRSQNPNVEINNE